VQAFRRSDIGRYKAECLAEIIDDIQFEKNNPSVPNLDVITYNADFLSLSEDEILAGDGRKIIIMGTDYHPAQARGNRFGLKFDIPVFWMGIYKNGEAGEIIFINPYAEPSLPCYRCITKSRYEAFDRNHMKGHLIENINGRGTSSGLPMVAQFIDSVAAHLVIGCIHKDISDNPHGRLYNRLLVERRNFIQLQLNPDYRLAGENIFEQINGPDIVSFNTLFQQDEINVQCPDCSGVYRCGHFNLFAWQNTDYLKESISSNRSANIKQ
jgi:molybdopterin/thiamine biosynthesis adenylyltransferase